jgi:lipoprotein-anchoring transpeptidase ErfK/SrfK
MLYGQQSLTSTNLSGDYNQTDLVGTFHGYHYRFEQLPDKAPTQVLGSSDPKVDKHIEVDLQAQKLYPVENGKKIAEFDISTGKWGQTPTGEFTIWIKLKYTHMSGGNQALGTYYNLPNVPYTMFFYNNEIPQSRGYGIHGTYWHSNYGEPMSHGCINMRTRDVEKLFYWATPEDNGNHSTRASSENPGTRIVIY